MVASLLYAIFPIVAVVTAIAVGCIFAIIGWRRNKDVFWSNAAAFILWFSMGALIGVFIALVLIVVLFFILIWMLSGSA